MILADLEIGGAPRKVLMQAPKNGFFYVLDRATGELLSAEPFATVDLGEAASTSQTGRPIETPRPRLPRAAWSRCSRARSARTTGSRCRSTRRRGSSTSRRSEIPYFFRLDPKFEVPAGRLEHRATTSTVADAFPRELVSGHLLAWDPVAQKEVWRAQYTLPWNGGTLTTAGNLVFQGTAHGTLRRLPRDATAKLCARRRPAPAIDRGARHATSSTASSTWR